MTGLLILLASIFTGIACYNLSCAFVDVPTAKTSRMMMLAKKQTGTGDEKLFDVYLTKVADKLSPLLKLDPIKKGRLSMTLSIAHSPCGHPVLPVSAAFWLFDDRACRDDVVFHLLQSL